ncbi:MAG TPA: 4a-hydroxytetrahydrobiopterin dehydratase [Candidatus Kapabacteria bacterium]|jgi:4a-hydroxytetrahydrobiopterin dehydratase
MAENRPARLNSEEIEVQLRNVPAWSYDGQQIERTFVRKNFMDAVRFISEIAPIAEAHDHHPDLLLSSYKNVKVMLSTHSESGITSKDFDVAKEIDRLAP